MTTPSKSKQNIERYFRSKGHVIEQDAPVPNAFGIRHRVLPLTLLSVNEYFVRFEATMNLKYEEVRAHTRDALEFVNDVNQNATLLKVSLSRDPESESADLAISAIMPGLYDPEQVYNLYGVWEENLGRIVLHESYRRFILLFDA